MKDEKLEELRHKNRMEEIEYEHKCKLDIENTHHRNDMEMQRIRNADIRRTKFGNKY